MFYIICVNSEEKSQAGSAGKLCEESVNLTQQDVWLKCKVAGQILPTWIYNKLNITDENGESMMVSKCDPKCYLERNNYNFKKQ